MTIVFFPCLDQADTIDVTFSKLQGGEATLRLLVDSGFTGQSSFVLSETAHNLAITSAPASQAAGAIQGIQQRVVVFCRVPALSFHTAAIAILADLGPMALPTNIQGIVGLRFLRHFQRWGAEKTEDGSWRFFLETKTV